MGWIDAARRARRVSRAATHCTSDPTLPRGVSTPCASAPSSTPRFSPRSPRSRSRASRRPSRNRPTATAATSRARPRPSPRCGRTPATRSALIPTTTASPARTTSARGRPGRPTRRPFPAKPVMDTAAEPDVVIPPPGCPGRRSGADRARAPDPGEAARRCGHRRRFGRAVGPGPGRPARRHAGCGGRPGRPPTGRPAARPCRTPRPAPARSRSGRGRPAGRAFRARPGTTVTPTSTAGGRTPRASAPPGRARIRSTRPCADPGVTEPAHRRPPAPAPAPAPAPPGRHGADPGGQAAGRRRPRRLPAARLLQRGRGHPGPARRPPTRRAGAGAVHPALAAAPPVRIRISAIGVDSALIALGLAADGTLQVPVDGSVAGWFTGSPTPGEHGPAVIAAHVDWNHAPGVFFHLRDLEPGAEVAVDRADGTTARFEVLEVEQYPEGRVPDRARLRRHRPRRPAADHVRGLVRPGRPQLPRQRGGVRGPRRADPPGISGLIEQPPFTSCAAGRGREGRRLVRRTGGVIGGALAAIGGPATRHDRRSRGQRGGAHRAGPPHLLCRVRGFAQEV